MELTQKLSSMRTKAKQVDAAMLTSTGSTKVFSRRREAITLSFRICSSMDKRIILINNFL